MNPTKLFLLDDLTLTRNSDTELKCRRVHSNCSKFVFGNAVVRDQNRLPLSMVECDSTTSFKKDFDHLSPSSPCSLGQFRCHDLCDLVIFLILWSTTFEWFWSTSPDLFHCTDVKGWWLWWGHYNLFSSLTPEYTWVDEDYLEELIEPSSRDEQEPESSTPLRRQVGTLLLASHVDLIFRHSCQGYQRGIDKYSGFLLKV